jgi:hypothetical protein
VWLVYREDATFLSAFIIEQLDTLPFEIFDRMLLILCFLSLLHFVDFFSFASFFYCAQFD